MARVPYDKATQLASRLSREAARAAGKVTYEHGYACRNCGSSIRYVASGSCKQCQLVYSQRQTVSGKREQKQLRRPKPFYQQQTKPEFKSSAQQELEESIARKAKMKQIAEELEQKKLSEYSKRGEAIGGGYSPPIRQRVILPQGTWYGGEHQHPDLPPYNHSDKPRGVAYGLRGCSMANFDSW